LPKRENFFFSSTTGPLRRPGRPSPKRFLGCALAAGVAAFFMPKPTFLGAGAASAFFLPKPKSAAEPFLAPALALRARETMGVGASARVRGRRVETERIDASSFRARTCSRR
jgi:hypothetical protein